MSFADLRCRAAVVRAAPLESVLLLHGAVRDRHDRRRWHTERGPLSVTGPKFMNWHTCQGGGGAIDLVMHLAGVDFRAALAWLEGHFAAGALLAAEPGTRLRVTGDSAGGTPLCEASAGLRLPRRDDRLLGRVRRYLTERRHLAASVIEPLIESG